MREINPNLYPADGYYFVDKDGSKHVGETWRDLERKVIDYRARNRMPIGDPHTEVTEFTCKRLPSYCREGLQVVYPTSPSHSLSFNQKVIQWLANLINIGRTNPIARVPDEEAARRAAICRSCPLQRGIMASCLPCLDSIRTSRKVVLDGATSLHAELKPCGMLGEDCSTSVHIAQPDAQVPGLPDYCWRKAKNETP